MFVIDHRVSDFMSGLMVNYEKIPAIARNLGQNLRKKPRHDFVSLDYAKVQEFEH